MPPSTRRTAIPGGTAFPEGERAAERQSGLENVPEEGVGRLLAVLPGAIERVRARA
jgi:hypothetical protein